MREYTEKMTTEEMRKEIAEMIQCGEGFIATDESLLAYVDDFIAKVRADAIDEFADTMQLVKLTECDDVPRELIEAIEKQIGICALRVKEKMLKEQK